MDNCNMQLEQLGELLHMLCTDDKIRIVDDVQQETSMDNTTTFTGMTLEKLYPEWLAYKYNHTNSTAYIQRISVDWFKFYGKDDLVRKPIQKITSIELDDWVHRKIKEYQLTKTAYYNMSVILRQSLVYAKAKGYLNKNPFEEVTVNSKMFKRSGRKPDNQEVFLVDEQPLVVEELYRRFYQDTTNTAALAVILDFELGARVGEVAALQFSDIEGNYIHVQRQEIKEYDAVDGITWRFKQRKVAEYTKSEAGDRYIYLTETARAVIGLIQTTNQRNGEYFQNFLFVREGKRISERKIINQIERACKKIGISEKGMHKIRKTYISALIDEGLNINKVREQAGHSDERTTYRNYCFNRLSDKQTENLIEGALNCDIYSSRVNTLHAVKERVQTVPRQSPVHFCGKGIKIIPFPQE